MFRRDGAITIFLSLILSAMIALAGVLVDGSRLRAADTIVQDAVESSAQDILTAYDGQLKEDYGLMSIYNLSEEELEDYVFESLSTNLLSEEGYFDIYDFAIEDVKVTPIYNLTEPKISRRQIVEFMKYRAPLAAVDGFISKLGTIKSFSKQSKVLEKKIAVEKKLKDVREDMVGLYCETQTIREFDKNDISAKIDKYAGFITEKIYYTNKKEILEAELKEKEKELGDVKKSINSKEKSIKKLKKKIAKKKDEAEEGETVDVSSEKKKIKKLNSEINSLNRTKKNLDSKIRVLKNKIKDLQNKIKNLTSDADRVKNQLTSSLNTYRNANIKAADFAGNLLKSMPDIESQITEIAKSLDGDNSDFANQARNELLKMSKNVSITGLNDIKSSSEENQKITKAILDKIKDLEEKTKNIKTVDKNEIENQVDSKIDSASEINQYDNTLKYEPVPEVDEKEENAYKKGNKPKVDKDAKNLDPRDAVSEKVEDKKEEEKEDDTSEINDSLYSQLPSVVNLGKDEQKGETFYDNAEFDESSDDSKSEEGLNIFAAIGEKIGNIAVDMRDEIYFNEYLLMTFKNAVSDKEKLPDIDKLDFRGKLLTDRDAFFKKGEIEYILIGSRNENTNLLLVKGQVLAVRFAMNTISIYMDQEKRNSALVLATALAGWTGIGIPIVQTLLMCSWSMAESLIDLDTLLNGETVPFYKRNWVLSPKGGIEKLKDIITGKVVSEADKALDEVTAKVDSIISTKIENILAETFQKLEAAGDETEKILKDQINESLETTEESKGIMGEIERKIKEHINNLSAAELENIKDSYNSYLEKSQENVNNKITKIITDINKEIEGEKNKLIQELKEKAKEGFDSLEKYVDENISQKDAVSIKGDYIDMSYLDYLRLFLLVQGSEKTTLRTEDLIQINTNVTRPDFDLSKQNTFVKIEATISMKYMFITKSFMPPSVKTEDGERYIIHKVIYEGY